MTTWTHRVRVPARREVLLEALTARLPEVARRLRPAVPVEIRSRRGGARRFELVTAWDVAALVPLALRPVAGAISWVDTSRWDLDDGTCAWSSDVQLAVGQLRMQGRERYREDGGDTWFENECRAELVGGVRPRRLWAAVTLGAVPRLMRVNVEQLLAAAASSTR